MFEKKTVVIVGAGASKECNFPTGQELKSTIANLLDIRFRGGYELVAGDGLICESLQIAVQRVNPNSRDINPHLLAARQIRDAMPQAISIDNYIDAHQGNARLELCGKLAIVRAILEAERHSSMYVEPHRGDATPNYQTIEGSWFTAFMQLLTENCRVGDLEGRMDKVGLVIFNYDRCIEHYIFHWLQTYYRISAEQAASLVKRIDIFHPYGAVGKLPWQGGDPTMEFGGEPSSRKLLDLTGQIRTFTEGTDPGASDILRIRKRLTEAEILLFLGFAYLRLNLTLLRTGDVHADPSKVRYFGTALGISDSDCEQIRSELTELASANYNKVTLRNDLTCAKVFREYWRSLSLTTTGACVNI